MSVHERGDGRWQVRYRDAAGRQKSGGVYNLKGDAEQRDRDLKTKRRRGDLAPDARQLRVGELWEEFLDLHVGLLDPTTQRQWTSRWMPTEAWLARGNELRPWHLGHKWARYRLADVTYEAILRWHVEMRRAGASDARMWRAHDGLTAMLNFAWRKGTLARNPASQVGRPSYRPEAVLPSTIWLPADVEAIRSVLLGKAASGRSDYRWSRARDAVLVSVLGYCGLRPWDEGLRLEWPHVTDKTVTLVDTKTGDRRSVPLLEPVARELREWRLRCGMPKRGLVWPRGESDIGRHGAEPLWPGGWSDKVWRPAVEAAGLDYMRPYHLRHSCISMWLAEGRRHNVVAKWAGHSVLTLIRTYDHVIEEWEHREDLDMAAEVRRARGELPDARRLVAV